MLETLKVEVISMKVSLEVEARGKGGKGSLLQSISISFHS